MIGIGTDWRLVGGVLTAWFDAPTLTAGAALAGRIVELSSNPMVDLRATGLRVRLASADDAEAVSAAARELGLNADPAVLQQLSVVIESAQPSAVRRFWQRALDYSSGDDGALVDPLWRDPTIGIRQSTAPRPLRSRLHVDVVRPAVAVAQLDLGEASGRYGVCHRDPDGNEVDLVPGGTLGEGVGAGDWHAVFSAMACYRITSPAQQRDLTAAAAALADDAGFPLLIDLRPGLVIIDSGKDQWEADAHGLGIDFTGLAEELQAAARELGATADPGVPRFVQLFLDAADVDAARAFWAAALGYTPDAREGVSDLHDPRRLNPVLVFQELDTSETERRAQRNRIHLELTVPPDRVQARVAAVVTAGGRLLGGSGDGYRLADPEGNELVIGSGASRDAPACLFCAIAAGRAEASVVYEDDTVVVFMDRYPVTPGHVLVVPRRHAEGLEDLDAATSAHVWSVGHDIARALRRSGLRCEGINVLLCDGEVAFQTVFHFHLHVIPRYAGDGWTISPETQERGRSLLDGDAQTIRDALASSS